VDWQSVLSDAAIIASVATGIFTVIEFIKGLFNRASWGKKIPGEIWFGLSLAMAIGVGVAVYWDDWFGPDATVSSGIAAGAYSLLAGAGSKLINAVSGPAGAKLKAAKEAAQPTQNGNVPTQTGNVPVDVPSEIPQVPYGKPEQTSTTNCEQAEPLFSEVTPTDNKTENQAWSTARLLADATPTTKRLYWVSLEPDGPLVPLQTSQGDMS
jgi:hypothetical protein